MDPIFDSVSTSKGVERVVLGARCGRIAVTGEDAAEGGCDSSQLLRDALPGGDGDLAVDEAGLVPGDGREKEGEVLGHDPVGQPRRQRRHHPGKWIELLATSKFLQRCRQIVSVSNFQLMISHPSS